MEIKSVFLIAILSSFLLSQQISFENLTQYIGVENSSPTTLITLYPENKDFKFESSVATFYSFNPIENERLVSGSIGSLWGYKQGKFTVNINYKDEFSLFHIVNEVFNYSYNFRYISIGGGIGTTQLWSDEGSDNEFNFLASISYNKRAFSIATNYSYSHISQENNHSIPLGKVDIILLLRNNKIGNQGVYLSWNHSDRIGTVALSNKVNFNEWFSMIFALNTLPFKLGLGINFNIKRSSTTVFVSHHNNLGFSERVSFLVN